MGVSVKRVYEPASLQDGTRVLVDRIWPRGVSRERLEGFWLKELAPSSELRRWFGHAPERFGLFEERYRQELLLGDGEALVRVARTAAAGRVTLLYGARDPRHNQAAVLARVLEELLDPPPKAAIRRTIHAWRGGLAADRVHSWSAAVRETLQELPTWQEARGILLYLSVGHEVETLPLVTDALAAGKRVFAPQVDRAARRLKVGEVRRLEDLVPGPFQAIPEPRKAHPAREMAPFIDLVLLPGLAFDRFGNRIGYGSGYYDRLLPQLPPEIPRLALLFAGQLVPRCPATPGDQPVTGLVTDAGFRELWSSWT